MPTGYTAYIENGDITTGKDFLKLCTRAFGIAIDLKDKPTSVPTPNHFEPDSYYKERYYKALKELERAKSMSFDEAVLCMKDQYNKRISNYKSYAQRETEMNKKYTKVRKEVEKWNPPTEEHRGLKKFALEQIDMCVTKQQCIDDYIEKSKEKFDGSKEAVLNYIESNIECCQEEVDRAYKAYQEELKRTGERNKWMSDFLKSLE